MVVVLKPHPDEEQIQNLVNWLESKNLSVTRTDGAERTILGLIGDTSQVEPDVISALNIVDSVQRIQEPYKKASRKFHPDDTVVKMGNVNFGDGSLTIIAGPSAVESEEQINQIAQAVKSCGVGILRAGTFMPRTSPYAFQGLGAEAVRLLVAAGKTYHMPVVSEIMRISQLDIFQDIDIIQVGARNMQNFDLLKELGKSSKPVIISRGLSATLKELLMSAEYVLDQGNPNVILCERGIRTFETYTKNTFDVTSIPTLKELSHLPVIADPCHATGKASMVAPAAKAAAAAGTDGLFIQVHTNPAVSMSDQAQQITPDEFRKLTAKCNEIHSVISENEQ